MKPSRRRALKTLGLALAGAAVTERAQAQAKASKQAMQYQEQPKNGQECDGCMHYQPGPKPGAPGACKVVEGPISPKGWCVAWAKKS